MPDSEMQQLWSTSHLSGGNASYVEELYELYLHDPNSVAEEWRSYFDKLPQTSGTGSDISHSTIREHFLSLVKNPRRPQAVSGGQVSSERDKKQVGVLRLIQAYRMRGHQASNLDPLGLWQREAIADLTLAEYGLTEADLDTVFRTGELQIGKEEAPLREILDALKSTYCGTIGAEYMHIVDSAQRRWFQQRLESVRGKPQHSAESRRHLLERLTAAEGLEKYLGTKYPGTKRFGVEGGESLIPMLDEIIQRSGSYGVAEVVLGMAHRGRLNVLVNTLGKNPRDLFDEFEGKKLIDLGSGDVKYHQGFSSNVMTSGGEVHLALSLNPSHLEIVSPVVEGSVRARQDRRKDATGDKVLPISIHGAAAVAGQGVVMETFQVSQTRAYKTGGTIHIVVNNQVGFTTSRQDDARSTEYCTDIAKMIQAPIFHVNGDDPEAVLFVTQLAVDYRMQFKRDVVIDLVCYRRRGHNEADEPSGTQPRMYAIIAKHPTTREIYANRLVEEGVLDAEAVQARIEEYRNALANGDHVVKSLVKEPDTGSFVDWAPYLGHQWTARHDTRFDPKTPQALAHRLNQGPDGRVVQRQVSKIVEDRRKMAAGGLALNWGFAETMAYATLVHEGHPVRITGQDVGRGTFSHRHAVLHNQKEQGAYVPLANLSDNQPRFDIYDSLLSEDAVLSFEYGYATTTPNALVVW